MPTRTPGSDIRLTDLQQLWQLSEDMLCIASMDRFIQVNPTFAQRLGYSESEIVGKRFVDFLHPDDIEPTRRIVEERLKLGLSAIHFRNRYRHRDGSWRWLDWMTKTSVEKDRLYAVARDVTESVALEEALKESEARYRAIVESSPLAILIHDRGTLLFVNPAMVRMAGVSRPEELLGQNVLDWTAPATRTLLQRNMGKLYQGEGPTQFAGIRFEIPRGRSFDADAMGNLIQYQGKPAIQGVLIDRTEEKKAKAFSEKLIETANTLIVVLDAHGKVLVFNHAAESITGYTLSDLKDCNWFDVLVPEDRYPEVRQEFNRLMAGGLPQTFENPILTRSGEERIILWQNNELREDERIIGVVSFGLDVTETRRAEQTLRENQFWLQETQRAAQIGSYKLDVLRQRWFGSSTLDQIFGIGPDFDRSVAGWLALIHPEDRKRMTEYLPVALRDGHFENEYRIIRASDQAVHWVWGLGQVKKDAAGNPLEMIGTIQDITERKMAEAVISDSLHEKEVLLAEIHHRVKNNLNIIISLLRLQLQGQKDAAVIGTFQEVENRIRSIALVHDQLYRTLEKGQIHCGQYFKNLIHGLAEVYNADKRGVRLQISADRFLDVNSAVPCGLIVNELVTNSLKHGFPPGRTGDIHVALASEGEHLVLEVADSGIGFPEMRLPEQKKGLGLEIVHGLAKQLNGTVEFDVQRGTRIRIVFKIPLSR